MARGKHKAIASARRTAEEWRVEVENRDRRIDDLQKRVEAKDAEIARLKAAHRERVDGLQKRIEEGTSAQLDEALAQAAQWEERHASLAVEHAKIKKLYEKFSERMHRHFVSADGMTPHEALSELVYFATGERKTVVEFNADHVTGKLSDTAALALATALNGRTDGRILDF